MNLFSEIFILISISVPSLLVPLPKKENADVGIVNPDYTDIHTHSYTVAIVIGMDLIGGGVLVRQNWVLTAASVIQGYDKTDITIRAGSNSPYFGGHLRNASLLVVHPQYATNQSYNLGLVKLDRPFFLKVASRIKYLARVPFRNDRSFGNLTGFGQQSYGSEATNDSGLEILDMMLYSNKYCKSEFYTDVPDVQFCAQSADYYSAPCFGDIGDPLAKCVRPGQCELLGIYTGDNPCQYGISSYMDIGQFYDWIKQTAGL